MVQRLFEGLDWPFDLQTIALDSGPLRSSFERLGKTTVLSEFRLLPPTLEQRVASARGLTLRWRGRTQWQLANWKPDVILFNSCASITLTRYLALPRAPHILYVQETGRLLHHFRTVNQPVFDAGFATYLAVSQHVSRALQSEGVDPEKIAMLPNFLPAALLEKLEKLRQNRPQKTVQTWVIGGAGTLGWTKGPETWLQMAAQLSRILGHDNVRFEWVGGRDTETDHQFVWMAHQLGLQSNFELVPMTPDPFPHYVKFDIFALTSWEDASPLVVLENMTLGNVVACFAESGGAPEIVDGAGIIIEQFDPNAMAVQIAAVLKDAPEHARKTQKSRQQAHVFDEKSGSAILTNILEKVLDKMKT